MEVRGTRILGDKQRYSHSMGKTHFWTCLDHWGNPVKLSFTLGLEGGKELTLPIYLQSCKNQQLKLSFLQFLKQ